MSLLPREISDRMIKLREQSGILGYASSFANDFVFHSETLLKEQAGRTLTTEPEAKIIFDRLAVVTEQVLKLRDELSLLASQKLREADFIHQEHISKHGY